MKNQNVFFRAGIGIILYREGKVAFFERLDTPGHWQFPQGGLYQGESVLDAMWRELREETGLRREAIGEVHEVPFITSYVYPHKIRDSFAHSGTSYIGQSQFWFIVHLKDESKIDMSQATDKEFGERNWVAPHEATDTIVEWKREAYRQLMEYFMTHIDS